MELRKEIEYFVTWYKENLDQVGNAPKCTMTDV